jgi:hypothetical protein
MASRGNADAPESRVDSESRFAILSQEFVENETRFSQKNQCESHESCEKEKMRYIVKQTSKIIINSEKLVLDPKFFQDSRVKISNDSRGSR